MIETRAQQDGYPHTLVVPNVVDGVAALPGALSFERRNPAQRDDLVTLAPASTREQVFAACQAARRAFTAWSRVPAPERGRMLGRVARLLGEDKQRLARFIAREVGKPLREGRGSVQEAIDTAEFFQSEGRRLYGQSVPSELPSKELFTYRRPIGVVGLITAGNFPIAVPSWKIIPALLTGNTVVWKPSDDAPGTAALFFELLRRAGVPAGVLNIVHGGGAAGAGEWLIEAVDQGLIDKVSFTGSTAVGRKIGEVCGRRLQVPSLELGGKNPLVVLADADLELAVEGAIWASYGTAGQRCTSAGNLIVDRRVMPAFRERFVRRATSLKIGAPLDEQNDYGPLINQRFLERWIEQRATGMEDGATLLLDGKRITATDAPSGFSGDGARGMYATPRLFDGVRIDMRIAQEECFGPTVNLIEVDGLDEAIATANGTPYGLSSAVYTRDAHAMLRFKEEIRAGMTSINNSTTGAEAHMPFGGNGWSGNGTRESGIWVLDAYTRWQAVNVDLSGKLQKAQIDLTDPDAALGAPLDAVLRAIPD